MKSFTSNTNTINVVHVVSATSNYGGHILSSIGIAKSLADCGNLNVSFYLGIKNKNILFSDLPSKTTFLYSKSFSIFFNLISCFKRDTPDILHIHGAWTLITFLSCFYGFLFNIPVVIHPHGMLSSWALGHKSLKKNIAFFTYQKWCLVSSKLIIATSLPEFRDICNIGFGNKCNIIRQGIKILNPNFDFRNSLSSSRIRYLLFLSRLHPVKGIFELLESWRILKPSGWVLNIAGPDEDGNLDKINDFIATHNLRDSVNILGPADDLKKCTLFKQADLFILPSHSENFGIVILEAISFGLPVITTKNTPWQILEDRRCGWCIDMSVNKIISTLSLAINLSDKERAEMGKDAFELSRSYDLNYIALDILKLYKSLL